MKTRAKARKKPHRQRHDVMDPDHCSVAGCRDDPLMWTQATGWICEKHFQEYEQRQAAEQTSVVSTSIGPKPKSEGRTMRIDASGVTGNSVDGLGEGVRDVDPDVAATSTTSGGAAMWDELLNDKPVPIAKAQPAAETQPAEAQPAGDAGSVAIVDGKLQYAIATCPCGKDMHPAYGNLCEECGRKRHTDTSSDPSDAFNHSREESADEAHARRGRELADEVAESAIDVAEARAASKSATKRLEAATEAYAEWRNSRPEVLPLFDLPSPAIQQEQLPEGLSPATSAETPTETAGPQPAGQDDWKTIPIDRLDIPAGTTKLLIKAGIDTIGKLAEWTTAHDGLRDVKGIGEGKAEKVNNALVAFWASNPQFCRGS